jgi:uncharacterized protein YbjT (DUF2867 family)
VLASRQWDGQTLVLTGPRAVSFAEIADLISARAGRQVGHPGDHPGRCAAPARRTRDGRWEGEHFQEMYQLFRDGRSEFVTGVVERLLGRAPGTVEEHVAAIP